MAIVLSIIVPIYNVEHYLARCIDSLLNQDIVKDDYEIILVDDGSTDSCGSICDDFANREENIKVIHQSNQGLSAARNAGLFASSGEYIQFVDSDDFIQANVLKLLLAVIKKGNLDILRFNYENVDEYDKIIYPNKNPKLFADYSSIITNGKDFLINHLGFACYACQFIVRRDLMVQYPFTLGIHFEDTEWAARILPSAHRVSSTDQIVYFYRIRRDSITKSSRIDKIRKNIEDQIRLVELFKSSGNSIPHPSWYDSMISITVLSVLGLTAKCLYQDREHILSNLHRLKAFPLTTFRQTKDAVRKIHLINFSPRLYCFLLHSFK